MPCKASPDIRPARSTAEMAEPGALYHHEQWGAVECMGCHELIEIPAFAVIKSGFPPVRIKADALNLLLWCELIELDHAPCLRFFDAEMASQARTHHNRISRGAPR